LRRRFFEINEPWEVDPNSVLQCFAVGCAFCDQVADLWERRLHLVRRNHACKYLGQLATQEIFRVKDLTGDSFAPDGMSGGAVLFIRDSAFGPRLEFGGMIQRGGNSYFQCINATQILVFADAAIDSLFSAKRTAQQA
jgi:hypothetical protein